jgi:flavin reductase (DIM6/NTAB) family NADH-FMN oxidoreductase RutF
VDDGPHRASLAAREALAWFECQVVGEHPAGDHVLVLGKVIDGKLLDSEAEPMSYRQNGAMDGASELCFPTFSAIDGAALRQGITIDQPSG